MTTKLPPSPSDKVTWVVRGFPRKLQHDMKKLASLRGVPVGSLAEDAVRQYLKRELKPEKIKKYFDYGFMSRENPKK
jgi:hypothetical protein